MARPSLYRRILGDRFDALPAVLRRLPRRRGRRPGARDVPGGARARPVRNGVASILGMPRAGTHVPVRLQVVAEGDRERWIRDFDGHRVETVQWGRGESLMEAMGRIRFCCELVLDGSRLRYEFRRAWFAGIPIPRWISPSIVSYVEAGEATWFVVVHVLAPFLGQLVKYEGWIEPE